MQSITPGSEDSPGERGNDNPLLLVNEQRKLKRVTVKLQNQTDSGIQAYILETRGKTRYW